MKQCVNTLPEEHLTPHIPRLLESIVSILETTQEALKHRANIQPFAITPLKAIKNLAVTALVNIFNTFDEHTFTEEEERRLVDVVIEPNIVALPDESLQSCTPLLLFIESLARHRITLLTQLCRHGNNGHVLKYVLKLLIGKGVVSAVSSRVIGIVFLLLDQPDDGITILKPHIPFLAEYLHCSLRDILHTKKGKNKKKLSLPKHFKLELELLSRLSLLVTNPAEKKNLVLSILCSFEGKIIYRPDDIINSARSLYNLISDSSLLSDNSLISIGSAILSSLLTSTPDSKARIAVCKYFTITNHSAAGVLEKLHAFNKSYIDDPDFEARLEGYRDVVSQLESGCHGDDTTVFLLPCVSNAVYNTFASVEMAIRDAASNTILEVIEYISKITSSEQQAQFYKSLIVDVVLVAIKQGIQSADEVFQNEAIVLIQAIVKAFPDKWASLAIVSDVDPEQDFFENIRHIQVHRRTRALARLKLHVEGIPVNIAWDFLLPLLQPVFITYG